MVKIDQITLPPMVMVQWRMGPNRRWSGLSPLWGHEPLNHDGRKSIVVLGHVCFEVGWILGIRITSGLKWRCWSWRLLQEGAVIVIIIIIIIIINYYSGQIIATSHDLTPNGGLVREIPLFQGNLGWWNIIIWPDYYHHHNKLLIITIIWANQL